MLWIFLQIALFLLAGANGQNPGRRPVRKTRVYYVAAVEEDWNFAPDGGPNNTFAQMFLRRSRNPIRIGSVYLKALFREFTDGTYKVRKERPAWMGILGPLFIGEVGDAITVHFWNNASFPISIHPHGLRYEKRHEGALYEDNTKIQDKIDDMVPPGERYQYDWFLIEEDAPQPKDPDCLTWVYHSHRNADTDLHAGLLGPLVVCRRGTLPEDGSSKLKSFPLLFLAFNENDSDLIDANIRRVAPGLSDEERERLKANPAFRQSNLMFTINGLSFMNLKGLDLCLGDKVEWHMIGIGNEVDVHSIIMEGQIFVFESGRTDTINLFPAKFATISMTAKRVGRWPIRCEVGRHTAAGMEAEINIRECGKKEDFKPKVTGIVRKYYIASEEVIWDYGPTGINQFTGRKLTEDRDARRYFINNKQRIGGKYKKVLYVEYTDGTFKKRKKRTRSEIHIGHMGPTIRAEVGDAVEITFLNKARMNYSLHTHGAYCTDPHMHGMPGTGIPPGGRKVYKWLIPESYGPTKSDPDCLTWRYFSGENFVADFYDGMNGVFLSCRKGSLKKSGEQAKVDREFSLLFAVMDENDSHYIEENIRAFANKRGEVNRTDPDFMESNEMHAINGRTFGNVEGLRMCKGERVSWHIVAFGKVIDLHVAYFHGQTFEYRGVFRDTVAVVPSAHQTVVMTADNPGEWILECRTNDHLRNGMRAIFIVDDCGGKDSGEYRPMPSKFPKKARVYYIGAIEEEWDYAPLDRHIITGESLLENVESRPFVENTDNRIGRKYKKALFRQFTDSTFKKRMKRGPEEEHLGVLGPMIKGEVGDTIRVVFKNMASRPYSIHPHGVVYINPVENVEGRRAIDRGEIPVEPGDIYVYEWDVPTRSGPLKPSNNCTTWAYYSSVDPVRDPNTGLIGPLVICRKGVLSPSGRRKDVDHEFAVLFTIFDENESWLLEENIRKYARRPETVDVEDTNFEDSNTKYSVNGRIYGNVNGLVARPNQTTAWYMIGMGTEIDMHTAHFHGQTFLWQLDRDQRGDVVDLFPGVFETLHIRTDNPGTWFLHCHVDDHMRNGMNAVFTVLPSSPRRVV